ncbi:hypothetical protein [Streptomyces sp. NRRL S-244]|uniref:hypothetical protein n=1 Tax=Streptomyces sp. NRRL S-244 TaxID=1463897 RepID=UPI00131A5F68|nr:hypothetical protein [Streptomyces sp. NRRL S-244]
MGTVVCALFLMVGNLATGYLAMLAYAAQPRGPWDSETAAHSGIAAGLALALAFVTALLTWVFVKAEWLRRVWFAIPALLALSVLLRLTLLSPEL